MYLYLDLQIEDDFGTLALWRGQRLFERKGDKKKILGNFGRCHK